MHKDLEYDAERPPHRGARAPADADVAPRAAPYSPAGLLDLQRLAGNRAVSALVASKPPQPAIQRSKWVDDTVVSDFDSGIKLSKREDDQVKGSGGALTVYLTGSAPFWHREVCLEWYDGVNGWPTHLAAHLTTPALADRNESTWSKLSKQVGSFIPGGMRHQSIVAAHDGRWTPAGCVARVAPENRRTVGLGEDQKETKRALIEGEIGKTYNYDIANLGFFGKPEDMNCKDWADKVASEAII